MDPKGESDQSNSLMNRYDDDRDSDIESRLYAEIYYSNTIIGDENNATNSVANNKPPDGMSNQSSKQKESNIFRSSEKEMNQHAQSQSNDTNYKRNKANERLPSSSTANSAMEIPNIQVGVNLEKELHNSPDISTPQESDRAPKSNKRSLSNLNNDQLSKSNKKRKKNGYKNNNKTQENTLEFLQNNSSTPIAKQRKEINTQKGQNKIINPYNKNLVKDQQRGVQLLSPAFLHLFFSKKSKKKVKRKLKAAQKGTGKPLNNELQQASNNLLQMSQENHPEKEKENEVYQNNATTKTIDSAVELNSQSVRIENKIEQTNENEIESNEEQANKDVNQDNNLFENSEIIDISSESSKDSEEDISKYNMTLQTEKKLRENEGTRKDVNSEDLSSDSEESIFEVPVPPKPAPPLIELKDSDNEHNEDNESSDSESSSDYSISQINMTQNEGEKSLNTTINVSDDVLNINDNSNELDNLILNCTVIQKGASSLSDIKRMTQASNTKTTKDTNYVVQNILGEKSSRNVNMCNVEHLHGQQSKPHDFANENLATNNNVVNTLNNKQKNKACSRRQNIPIEEYFFQPMTDTMKSFYNESWGGENFDMDQLKSKMSNNPNRWRILNDDLVPIISRRKRYFGMVCSRCQKEGHRQHQCSEPYKGPICHMCGIAGHYETACPHKKCLTCGKKQAMYRKTCEQCERICCSRCNSRGHMSYSCPDLWRRYHQTINSATPEIPVNLKNVMKPQHALFCCNCARKGHDSSNCKKLRWSQHFTNPPCVTNYNGPTYFVENVDSSKSTNDTSENSFNLSTTYNDSSYFDSTLDNSIDLNISDKLSSNKNRNRNDERMRQSSSANVLESGMNIIFKIQSKNFGQNLPLQRVIVKLNIPENNVSSNYENWKGLSTFLNSFVLFMPGEFILEQINRKMQMNVNCSRKYVKFIKSIIEQYVYRNDFERSYMFIKWERNSQKLVDDLKFNMTQMSKLKDDPLKLYEETKQLAKELMNKDHRTTNDLRDSLKVNKLVLSQQKLLMILYREGCCDDSLRKLKKIHSRIKKTINYTRPGNQPSTLSVKCMLQYLYYYNNVFVPYESKKIATYISKYKEHIERRERLRTDPLLFPPKENVIITQDEANENVTQSNTVRATVTSENYISSLASTSQVPPLLSLNASILSQIPTLLSLNAAITSQIPPLLPDSSSSNIQFSQELSCNISNSISQNNRMFTSTRLQYNQEQSKEFKNPPNGLYSESLINNRNKTIAESQSRLITEEANKLIAKACKLNAPHLRRHIDILQNKIKNEIYIYKKDVKLLKNLVHKELRHQQEKGR